MKQKKKKTARIYSTRSTIAITVKKEYAMAVPVWIVSCVFCFFFWYEKYLLYAFAFQAEGSAKWLLYLGFVLPSFFFVVILEQRQNFYNGTKKRFEFGQVVSKRTTNEFVRKHRLYPNDLENVEKGKVPLIVFGFSLLSILNPQSTRLPNVRT